MIFCRIAAFAEALQRLPWPISKILTLVRAVLVREGSSVLPLAIECFMDGECMNAECWFQAAVSHTATLLWCRLSGSCVRFGEATHAHRCVMLRSFRHITNDLFDSGRRGHRMCTAMHSHVNICLFRDNPLIGELDGFRARACRGEGDSVSHLTIPLHTDPAHYVIAGSFEPPERCTLIRSCCFFFSERRGPHQL